MTPQSGPGHEDPFFVDPETLQEYESWADGTSPDGDASDVHPACLNCGATLSGQYCGQCGQRAKGRLISVWELTRDAFGDLFELDSRLWQTVIPLLRRPGLLTADYLNGRRARYMPPFRMYLVLSLAFFVIAFFDPREAFGVFFDPDPGALTDAATSEERGEIGRELAEELAREGIVLRGDLGAALSEDEKHELEQGLDIRINDDGTADTICEFDDFTIEGPDWLTERLTPERAKHVCEQLRRDQGRRFVSILLDNVPIALFVLLPVMACVLKALYPLSRRYYVEHLLFVVHFHAFFFLILTLEVLLARLTAAAPVPGSLGTLVIVAASLYIPVYLFVAMRRVYGQGRIVTFLKYSVLAFAYLVGFTLTMLWAVAVAVFSV